MNYSITHLYIFVGSLSFIAFSLCAYYGIKPWYKKKYSDKNIGTSPQDSNNSTNSINSYYSIN
jgi:hypothetical protein